MAHSEQTNGLGKDQEAQDRDHTEQEAPASSADQETRTEGTVLPSPSPRRKGLVLCCLAAALVVGGYVFLCGMGSQGRIFPHVTVDGVSLGGLTIPQAQAALEKAEQGKTPDESRGVAFLVTTAQGEELAAAGWQVERFDGYAVAWK